MPPGVLDALGGRDVLMVLLGMDLQPKHQGSLLKLLGMMAQAGQLS